MKKIRFETKLLKSICAVMLSLALVISGLFPLNVVNAKGQIIPNDETGIPDKYLYQAILFELGKTSDKKITDDDLEEVYSIGGYFIEKNENKKIKNLEGLEKFENLHSLEIPISGQASLNGIEKIPNLESLTIRNGKLKNISELTKMPKLTHLTMRNVKVEDWSAISEMAELTYLEIYKCNFKNFKQISGLTNLEYLTINKTKIKNLEGVENLTNLHGLYASDNRLTNLSGIEKLTQLVDLDVSKNKIKNLPSLKKHTSLSLEYTWFGTNKISEKEFKKNLPAHALEEEWWVKNQVLLQNTAKKLKISKVKKIESATKEIAGITEKNARVVLMTAKGEKIAKVNANKKGKFIFKKLDLKEYKGKKLKITAYLLYDDQINGERHYTPVKIVKFKVGE